MKKLTIMVLTIIVFVLPLFVTAAEDPFSVVLQTLSSSLGTTVTTEMLDNHSWSEVTFDSQALGCPQPGQAYGAGPIEGYQVFVIYQGILYDYRVSADATNVILCATSDTTVPLPQFNEPVGNQGQAPDSFDIALQTLSTALNTSIQPEVLDTYTWSEVAFPSTALGCPQPGQAYAAVVTNGYQIILVYNGVRYDYRVTLDGQRAVLCSASALSLSFPQEPIVVAPVSTTVPPADTVCANALMPRLALNTVARTTPRLGSHIRETPDIESAELGLIPESTTVMVVDGPQCGPDGYFWWLVDYNGLIGWTIQGQNGLYYIEPIPQPLPTTNELISSETATEIIPLTEIEGNILGISAWSPDGQTLAIADASTAKPAIWLYNVADLTQVPRILELSFDTTALAFSPDGSLLVVGDPEGNVHLIDFNTFTIVHSFTAHDTAVLDIDFSPNGQYMVVIDDNYSASFFGVVTP